MLDRDHTARLPLETKLEIIQYLKRRDLFKLTTISRVWRAAMRLDPRFFVHACACAGMVKAKRQTHSNSKALAVCSLEEALKHQFRIAIEFNPNGIDRTFCYCASRDGPSPETDWAKFSRSLQPLSRLVRELRVVASDVPHGGLFDHTLATLHSLTLRSVSRSRSKDRPQSLPQWLTTSTAPLLRSLKLHAFHLAAPAGPFTSITTLSLSYGWCRLPEGENTPIPLASTFPQLRHLTLKGYPSLSDEEDISVLRERWIDWRDVGTKLQLLDLALGRYSRGSSVLPNEVLEAPEFARETTLDSDWHAALFMATVVDKSTSTSNTDVKMVYLNDLKNTSTIISAAQATPNGSRTPRRTRVLVMSDPFCDDWEEADPPHCELVANLTSLTLPSPRARPRKKPRVG